MLVKLAGNERILCLRLVITQLRAAMLLKPLVVVSNREGTDVTSDVTYALI